MRVYIAGSISDGDTLTEHERGIRIAQFHEAEALLKTRGYDPVNPARAEGREKCATWLDYMRVSLLDIATVDGIALLPGWEKSAGARIEKALGVALGLVVAPLDLFQKDTP